MTNKEFKRLNRSQLIDIIYQLQLQIDALTEQNQELERALRDKRLRIENVGSLAEAALVMNECFQSAQKAAEQYLDEIKQMRKETEAERQRILAQAQEEASAIIVNHKIIQGDGEPDKDADLKKCGQDHSDNG